MNAPRSETPRPPHEHTVGTKLVALAAALSLATALPSRWVLSAEQAVGSTKARALYLAGGLLCDLAVTGPVFVVCVGLAALVACNTHPFSPELEPARSRRTNGPLAAVSLLLGTLFVVVWLSQNGAMEFRLDRGIFPGPLDAREGLGHGDFVRAELPVLLGGRYLFANLGALASAALSVRALHRTFTSIRGHVLSARRLALTFALVGIVAFSALGFGARQAHALCTSLHNGGALVSPTSAFVSGMFGRGTYDGSPAEVRKLVLAYAERDHLAEGARAYGFSADVAPRLEDHDCTRHPLARKLDAPSGPLVDDLRRLSRALFAGREVEPVIYQVSLESLRADDVHALAEEAPAALTPTLGRLYADPATVAFRNARQSGIRTAQALSAVVCGTGALPFHLALGRDLGNVPLRCLPDVLSDAGLRTRAFYGHEFVFDDMGTFLRLHGVELHERSAFSAEAPRGVWGGVSDAPVYAAALEAGAHDAHASYNFVLTLSHHTPFTEPSDLRADERSTVARVCDEHELHGENCARLVTLHYADAAFGRFLANLEQSPAASRSMVIFSADHTTHQWVPWGERERSDGISRIPAGIVLPRALRDASADPRAVEAAIAAVRAHAEAPLSNEDLPTVVLALASETSALRKLDAARRWHTLGAQATSPDARSPSGRSAVWGIDAHAHLFEAPTDGSTTTHETVVETLRGPADLASTPAELRPPLAFWSTFLSGFAATCPRVPRESHSHEAP